MIDRSHALPVTRQAREAGISRGSVHYLPRPTSAADLAITRPIDALHMDYPFAGSRMLRDLLAAEGIKVGRLHVSTLMEKMAIEAICRWPNTSKPAPGHKIYPYLLRKLAVTRPNQVWATDITYIPMGRGFVYLIAIVDGFSWWVLSWRLSITLETDFCTEAFGSSADALRDDGDLQHGSGQPIYQHGVHRRPAPREGRDQHGRPRRLARQCVRRAPVALCEIRGGLPAGLWLGQRGLRLDRPLSGLLQWTTSALVARPQDARSRLL
jgi:putative transposase